MFLKTFVNLKLPRPNQFILALLLTSFKTSKMHVHLQDSQPRMRTMFIALLC
jgi:hypothetical protein